ncbi:MAG: thioredoxin [Pirellulaceae bacterium]|nr:MAG: thioredoxin [Pirellulaceae bacterium]
MDCRQTDARGVASSDSIAAGGAVPRLGQGACGRGLVAAWWLGSLVALVPAAAAQEDPRLAKALSYTPLQSDVRFEKVEDQQVGQCSLEETTRDGVKGFWVTGPAGQPLRWFADTNKDNRLDRWSYYYAGVEVYRELDTDFNGTADQFRWLNTEGVRHGIDHDEDGQIDRWLMISAEEVSAEVVAAAAQRDVARFVRLLPTEEEVRGLGLSAEKAEALFDRVSRAKKEFATWANSQKAVTRHSQWTHFGADKPGLVPAGTDGSEKDIIVYENAVALFEDQGKPRQLLIGTLVRCGEAWRVIDLPKEVSEGTTIEDGGMFFAAAYTPRSADHASGGLSPVLERLITELQQVDEKLLGGQVSNPAPLHAQRSDVLEKLVAASEPGEERSTWIRQFADTVSAAAQMGEFPEGTDRLRDFVKKLAGIGVEDDDMAYVVYRAIETDYRIKSLEAKEDEIEPLQKAYLTSLEAFIKRFPQSAEAADAMIQLALSAEFAGQRDEAAKWYRQAAESFPSTLPGRKAAGALQRLALEGKPLRITAKTLDGRTFNSAAYTGGPVIYHCWATWCDSCKAEMRALKQLQEKYAKQRLRIVGINFDDTPDQARKFVQQQGYQWLQLHDEGGFESELAVSHGILTLPLNFVVDAQGRVVKTGVHWSELDDLIGKMVQ